MSVAEPDADTVPVPEDTLAEFVRKQVKLDCELRVHAPEGVEIDEWEHIDTADVEYVEHAHGDLHAAYKSETTIQELTHRATRWDPPAYAHHDADVLISVTWDMDPAALPIVDIEVVER